MASPARDTDTPLLTAPSDAESQLSALFYDTSQQVQLALGNMLKMIGEIDQNSAGIVEEIAKCKDSALERKKILEEEKERFQKAAYALLGMLNNSYYDQILLK